MKRAAESAQRPLLLQWPIRSERLKVNTGQGIFMSMSSRRNRCMKSPFTSGNAGRSVTLLRRSAQLAHCPYSGWRRASRAYRFLAQSEFFRMNARPMGKMISGPGPGIGPNKGDPSTNIHPIVSIVQRKALVCRQYVHPDSRMSIMWGTENPAASHGHKFLR